MVHLVATIPLIIATVRTALLCPSLLFLLSLPSSMILLSFGRVPASLQKRSSAPELYQQLSFSDFRTSGLGVFLRSSGLSGLGGSGQGFRFRSLRTLDLFETAHEIAWASLIHPKSQISFQAAPGLHIDQGRGRRQRWHPICRVFG